MKTIRLIIAGLFLTAGAWAATIDEAIYQLGYKMYQNGSYSQASDQFNTLIAKHPYSPYFNASVYYCAKSYYAAGSFTKSLYYFGILERKAVNDTQMRQAVFGQAQSYYGLKNWAKAASYFENFIQNYKNSPVIDAAYYYAARSYEAFGNTAKALWHFQQIAFSYPLSPYYKIALEKSVQLDSFNTEPGKDKPIPQKEEKFAEAPKTDNSLNEVDLEDYLVPDEKAPNPVKEAQTPKPDNSPGSNTPPSAKPGYIDNTVHFYTEAEAMIPGAGKTTSEDEKSITVTNYVLTSITNCVTNFVGYTFTNMIKQAVVVTQYVIVPSLDSNTLLIQNIKGANQKAQEEIDRLRQLLEMKAKLLELKEKTLIQKEKIITVQTNK